MIQDKARFRTILADPPWPYRQKLLAKKARGGAEKGYPTMALDSIKALRVADWAMPDSLLWLWTTNSHLPAALEVVAAWGFTYRTMATWAKTHFGIGYWLRGQTEHLIFASRGDARPTRTAAHGALGSRASTFLGLIKRTRHSEKPEESYRLVESLCEGPYLELFARRQRPGWTCWGDELGINLKTNGAGQEPHATDQLSERRCQ